MGFLLVALSAVLIFVVLWDAFEAMVLPRRVTHPFRFARLFYRSTWKLWRTLACRLRPGKTRATLLSLFGPLSLLALFASWVVGLIAGFALLHWSLGSPVHNPDGAADFNTYLYLSGTTFFTLGYGDVTPLGTFGRFLTVVEAGLGFAFLACVIGYMPVLYQSFSRREVTISLLDARAGSPPSATQVLLRLAQGRNFHTITPFLAEWERWAAEVLESQLSYPVLSYYRSQHDNQSWLSALTAVLDTCALLIAGVKNIDPYQAQLTFAMSRHAVVDLALVFKLPPPAPSQERLTPEQLIRLRELLLAAGLPLNQGPAFDAKLAELRAMYEPFVEALAQYFLVTLPHFVTDKPPVDNWQTSPWTQRVPGIGQLPLPVGDEHFSAGI
ncbi:MAG: two pore domain potassium channel family protein [Planctomycetes bacterium]|nr:two pore domain potassium channel family protein [Planctomycetota bacterium]